MTYAVIGILNIKLFPREHLTFVKIPLALANGIRGYIDKTHLREFEIP